MPFLNRWGPVILWMVIIYTFSANNDPFQVVPQAVNIPDEIIGRIAHVFEFAVLTILVGRAFLVGTNISSSSAALIFLFSLSYGILDELHQSLIPERAFQLLDLRFDILGILIGLSLLTYCKSRV